MKLQRIKVKNFRSFFDEEFKFDIKTNANYIYGANGAGKSTFIKLLENLSYVFVKEAALWNLSKLPPQMKEQHNNNVVFNIYKNNISLGSNGEMSISVTYYDDEFGYFRYEIGLIEGDIVTKEELAITTESGEDKEIVFKKVLNKEFNASKKFYELGFKLGELNENTTSSIASLAYLKKLFKTKLPLIMENESKNIFDCLFNANLIVGDLTIPEIEELVTIGTVSLFKDINGIPADGVYSYEQKQKVLLDFIKSFEIFVCSIDKDIKSIRLFKTSDNNSFTSLSYEFEKDFGGGKTRWVPIQMESSGTKKYLEIFYRISLIQDPRNKNIILIDEIGSSLHEKLVVNIANYINKQAYKYNKHVFITTHYSILLNDKYVNRPNPKNANKEKMFINRTLKGKVKIDSLNNENIRNNNQSKFLMGAYGANPDIIGVYTDKDE